MRTLIYFRVCCTWKIIINQNKAELSNGKAAKRNPYGPHLFTFFPPPDKSSCPLLFFVCPKLHSLPFLIFLPPSEFSVSLLPFLTANYPSACHSDPSPQFFPPINFFNKTPQTHIHAYMQDKLKSRSLNVLMNLDLKDQAGKMTDNNIVKLILDLILQIKCPTWEKLNCNFRRSPEMRPQEYLT